MTFATVYLVFSAFFLSYGKLLEICALTMHIFFNLTLLHLGGGGDEA